MRERMLMVGWWMSVVMLAGVARAEVVVVDFLGGADADYQDLPTAIRAAADGDVLLLRSGPYDVWETLDGRSLTIVGDDISVSITGLLRIQNLAADQHVTLRNIHFRYGSQLELRDNAGTVWLEDSRVQADLYGGSGEYGAIDVRDSPLVIASSVVEGSIPYGYHATPPTRGLYAVNARVIVAFSTLVGGAGIDTSYPHMPGADGVYLEDSVLVAMDSSIIGGEGGTRPGGVGLVTHGGSEVYLRASTYLGGTGTPAGAADQQGIGSEMQSLGEPAHGLSTTVAPRVGSDLEVAVSGEEGDPVWLLAGSVPAVGIRARGRAPLLVSRAPLLLPLGTIPVSGTLSRSFVVPDLGAHEAVPVYLQDVSLTVSGGLVFGPGSAVTLVSEDF